MTKEMTKDMTITGLDRLVIENSAAWAILL